MKIFGLSILSYLSFVVCAFATHAEYKEFGDITPPEKMYTAETIDDAFLWKIEDSTGTNTAASVGTRTGDVGPNSMTIGENNEASGKDSIAAGQNATASDDTSFVWNGDSQTNYTSKGEGTFNVNTTNGLKGVFIGDTNLYDHIISMVLPNDFIMYYNTSFEEWPHEIDTEVYHEQSYEFNEESGYSGDALLIKLPTNSSLTYTKLNVYIHQFPQNSFYYDIASDNINSYPSRKFWMEEAENDSIWKFEFESFPGCKDWTLMRFIQREVILPIEMTKFYFNDGSIIETNIVGEMDARYASNINLTNVFFSSNITSIGTGAFDGCSYLIDVHLGENVETIDRGAFYDCSSLNSINIPNSIANIEDDAFRECNSLKAIYIDDLESWCKIEFRDNPLHYAHNLYLNGEKVVDLVIPDGITEIKDSSFWGANIELLSISDGVTNIEIYAFSDCTNLTSVTIPDSVTSIGGGAFFGCSSLTNVTLGDGVTSIGEDAFSGCNNINTFNYYRRDNETNEQAYNRISGLISGSGYDITGKEFICLNPKAIHGILG